MSEDNRIVATDIPIALYLNQRLTFDALATLENGFSHFSTVQSTSSGSSSSEKSGELGIGLSNFFAPIAVKFGVSGTQRQDQGTAESSMQEKVHTPTSLFARLRSALNKGEAVKAITCKSDLNQELIGEFVEFETTLRRSPLVEMLGAFTKLHALVDLQEETKTNTPRRRNQKGRTQANSQNNQESVLKQVESILSAVTAEGSQDLVGAVSGISVVITTEEKYFTDPSMNDVIDGTFRVFGKVTRVLPEQSEETISLLRNSPLGKFEDVVPQISDAMNELGGLASGGEASTNIEGPAIQVIPIAIFS